MFLFGYADDLALLAETEEVLQRFIVVWNEELSPMGMKISET